MKILVLSGVAAVALAAVPAFALQQGGAQPMTRAAVQTMVQTHFAQADANRDGFVTKAEAEARTATMREQRQAKRGERRAELFARLDANNDGSISQAEFSARPDRGDRSERRAERAERRGDRMERRGQRGAMGGRFGAHMFERADADKDGRLSLAEASAPALAMFDRVDADKNGAVSAEERRTAMQALRSARQARPNR